MSRRFLSFSSIFVWWFDALFVCCCCCFCDDRARERVSFFSSLAKSQCVGKTFTPVNPIVSLFLIRIVHRSLAGSICVNIVVVATLCSPYTHLSPTKHHTGQHAYFKRAINFFVAHSFYCARLSSKSCRVLFAPQNDANYKQFYESDDKKEHQRSARTRNMWYLLFLLLSILFFFSIALQMNFRNKNVSKWETGEWVELDELFDPMQGHSFSWWASSVVTTDAATAAAAVAAAATATTADAWIIMIIKRSQKLHYKYLRKTVCARELATERANETEREFDDHDHDQNTRSNVSSLFI